MARKYKQVHRKKIDFDIKDWEVIERRAEACHTSTTAFIRDRAISSEVNVLNVKDLAPVLNGMRIISNNINRAPIHGQ